jgi:DNA-binding PadR family transcriptional regulator
MAMMLFRNKVNELAILDALAGGELYGKEIRERTGINRGAIYVVLCRMENEGFIFSRVAEMVGPLAGRRMYFLTNKGLQRLEEGV